jgi:hypothetical protein
LKLLLLIVAPDKRNVSKLHMRVEQGGIAASAVTPIPSDILGFPDMGHGPATLGLGVVDSATRREQQDHGGHR